VAPELAVSLASAGAKALIIHGRTREQYYRGETDLQAIAAVKRAVVIPVIGNGDVVSVATARTMLEATGVDGIMIGRGAVGNPWLFAELQAELKNESRFSLRPVLFGDVIRRQVELAVASLGLDKAVRSMRRHLIAYTHGTPSGSKLRTEVAGLHSLADIDNWISALEASIELARHLC
ncbi:MAG: tRNA-dihydrouridine synthase, partial [Dehalococcoidia bacterium]|nr:tRNA-dihydrouridine synthase [Dehalococcoidia bacterium]